MQNPVVFVHGITAATLQDEYPLQMQELWSAALNKDYERLYLHPDNPKWEALQPSLVRPGSAFSICYDELIQSLRYELSPAQDQPTPVYSFVYDWRKSIVNVGAELGGFVEEVRERTKLLRHYKGWDQRVDLVGHSMGSLVICEFLSACAGLNKGPLVGKVVTLAGPFKGSLEAVVKLLTGMGYLSGSQPSERERELARLCAALYQLLPNFEGAISAAPGINADLFTPGAWQPSLTQSIQEHVRLYAVDGGNDQPEQNAAKAATLLKYFLDEAKKQRTHMDQLDLAAIGMDKSRWLAVAGLGARTRVSVSITQQNGQPWFSILDDDYVDEWSDGHASDLTGDTTVPLLAAIPNFLARENIVGVCPSDFGLFELKDKALDNLIGLHAQIPNMDLVQRLVIKHLRPEYTGKVWGRALPGVSKWDPPIPGLTAKT